MFASASRDYVVQRALVDAVPDESLLLSADELSARVGEWRALLLRTPTPAPTPAIS
jgi:hypothetical protein